MKGIKLTVALLVALALLASASNVSATGSNDRCYKEVSIDVKPNALNLGSNGVVTVNIDRDCELQDCECIKVVAVGLLKDGNKIPLNYDCYKVKYGKDITVQFKDLDVYGCPPDANKLYIVFKCWNGCYYKYYYGCDCIRLVPP
ncbi:hypothetical protein FTO70_13940 [Methanosarcina sp. KYL-1]|uniref:hypothetical protein n=1 Tax=Methanosarcina sp. KYL-1 TaxID=2602068 RepID=UPI002101A2C3|nr:hypothetical protein [Methanosarcina sp. KYL-1]MCQ1536751.1 hypothetical protein [Methanosarcina sp. KYL-1]